MVVPLRRIEFFPPLSQLLVQIRFASILSDMMFWWIFLAHMAFAHLEVNDAASHGLRLDGLLYPTNFQTALSLFLLDFISLFHRFIYPLTLALLDLSFCVPMVDFPHLASHIVVPILCYLC